TELNHRQQIGDYFDEDEFEGLREEDNNPVLNNPSIDMNLLEDALMEIDEVIEDKTSSAKISSAFSPEDLSTIRHIISCTVIPSWLNRPLLLFGDASAGKVRSANWITFFTIFMPFAIVELQISKQDEFVDSGYHLAMLTELAMEYRVDDIKIQKYLFHLTTYRSNLNENHPHLNPTPNHHMAFHLTKQLFNFGPANYLASWHFEQINGILQQIPTNKKMNQLDYTMLKQAVRASNLRILMESQYLPPLLAKLSPLFSQQKKLQSLLGEMSDLQDQSQEINEKINHINYVNEQKVHNFKRMGLTYTDSSDKGSSTIEYNLNTNGNTKQLFGKIVFIVQMALYEPINRSEKKTQALHISLFEKLSLLDEKNNPYPKMLPDLNIHVFYSPPLLSEENKTQFCDLITPNAVVYHAATFLHKSTTFNTQHDIVAVKTLGHSRSGLIK
ncbi:hypothetical protein MJO29_005560, partial [Puccinia striiformis f. sp. tritici]